jgi:large subunit ribosomal protein L1
MEFTQALTELRNEEKRKFDQTVDLVVSLKGVDLRKDSISFVSAIPHPFKQKRICAFFEAKNSLVTTVTKPEFESYKDKKKLRNLVKDYDFFIANAKLMPAVATTFGKSLGPLGKMPSPQLGILTVESPDAVKQMLDRLHKSVKVRVREPAVKVSIGKSSMSDKDLDANFKAILNDLVSALPAKKENIRKIMIKLTMSKPRVISP